MIVTKFNVSLHAFIIFTQDKRSKAAFIINVFLPQIVLFEGGEKVNANILIFK